MQFVFIIVPVALWLLSLFLIAQGLREQQPEPVPVQTEVQYDLTTGIGTAVPKKKILLRRPTVVLALAISYS